MTPHNVIVIGASSGGFETLLALVAQLPKDLPSPVFIVRHMGPEGHPDVLVKAFTEAGALRCRLAEHGEKVHAGRIYIPQADHHLMLGEGRVLVTKGARENRARPAIDALFRSAAVAYSNRVIAVLLTGYLDDGVAGLIAVQKCGGICVVQDPADAKVPDMPLNALRQITPDYVLPLSQIGGVLNSLARERSGKARAIPRDIATEAKIAERVLSDLDSVNALGEQVPFNCPNCGGVLWQVGQGKALRFRCHTGHAYTAPALEVEQSEKMEETLWIALRMFEENRNLLLRMVEEKSTSGAAVKERLQHAHVHIGRIKAMLLTADKTAGSDPSRR